MDLEADYRKILWTEYEMRKSKNKRFSLRAFAKFLNIDPSYLIKVIKGKAALSLPTAKQITGKLNLDKQIRDEFIISVADEQKCMALHAIDPDLTDCENETTTQRNV